MAVPLHYQTPPSRPHSSHDLRVTFAKGSIVGAFVALVMISIFERVDVDLPHSFACTLTGAALMLAGVGHVVLLISLPIRKWLLDGRGSETEKGGTFMIGLLHGSVTFGVGWMVHRISNSDVAWMIGGVIISVLYPALATMKLIKRGL